MTQTEEDHRPPWQAENRGWTEEEAKAFLDEVERLKDQHPETYLGPDISTTEALDNLRKRYPVYLKYEDMRERNEEGRRQRMQQTRKRRDSS
jgi:GH25 family lysozyme M1 (1,4-beta-N-acetylmuramidase)